MNANLGTAAATEAVRAAERELEAARKRSDVDAAARRLMRAKAELRELAAAQRPKRKATRGGAAGASS
jgi:hypothetical protein